MRISRVLLATTMVAAVGCSRKAADARPANQSSDTMSPMGSQMAMQGMQRMPAMNVHLDSMTAMPPAQMASAMAAHEDLASRTMDAMGGDMRMMNMKPDAAWTALSDSLRQDLAELSALSGNALKTRMEAHAGRMRRMMAMHEGMMKM
ncbi:MAG: hypothetical protein ABI613_10840 [Gemmatimonadota bacterium]